MNPYAIPGIEANRKQVSRKEYLATLDKAFIEKVIAENHNSVTKASRVLGMKRNSVYILMSRYGITINRKNMEKTDQPKIDEIINPPMKMVFSRKILNSDIVEFIMSLLPKYYNTTFDQINTSCRKRVFSEPRQQTIYLILKYTSLKQTVIGRLFTRDGHPMDHSTIIHARDTWQDLIDTEPDKRSLSVKYEKEVNEFKSNYENVNK